MYDASYSLKADTQTCSAEQMQNLNETKEYRLIATCAWREVLRDPGLSDAAVRVWSTIYELAARNDGMKIIISVRRLGEILSKSESSVRRAVRQLESAGYLSIGTRRTSMMGQGANSLAPRLPKQTAKRLFSTVTPRASSSEKVSNSPAPRLSKPVQTTPVSETCEQKPEEKKDEKPSNFDSQPVSLKTEARVAGRGQDALKTAENFLAKVAEEERKRLWKTLSKSEGEGAVKTDTHYSTSLNLKTNSSAGAVRFPKFLQKRTVARLSELGFQGEQLETLCKQVEFSLVAGVFRDHDPGHGVNSCLKLIAANTWRAPRGWA